ncbi:MAG: glycosyltransferase [Cytophagaceae bacterium]|nr:glycosyltransferase [Cytophagaceae bacterium]
MKILCIGPQWTGSNAGGIFRAFKRIGNLIDIIDENYYINFRNQNLKTKIIDKLFRSWHIEEFNQAIVTQAKLFNPDIVFIYKGAFVLPSTLKTLKEQKYRLVNFFPDVSFRAHGKLLPVTLPLYDHVFTTKTFGIADMHDQLKVKNSSFIPHGFDPELHRFIDTSQMDTSVFQCDVSFIGGYSPKKELMLAHLKKSLPEINLKIWGPGWHKASSDLLIKSKTIQYKPITGDLYVLGILSSKINLGILNEKVTGASSGDKITSRTFHIPGAGGFLLHEKTDESILYFEENREAAFFENEKELVEKVSYYLKHPEERELIRKKGHQRAWQDHSLDKRAELVVSQLKNIL